MTISEYVYSINLWEVQYPCLFDGCVDLQS